MAHSSEHKSHSYYRYRQEGMGKGKMLVHRKQTTQNVCFAIQRCLLNIYAKDTECLRRNELCEEIFWSDALPFRAIFLQNGRTFVELCLDKYV